MKYQESLDQKGLKLEQLSRGIQKKIQEIHLIDIKINSMKDKELDEELKDELEIYERTLKQIDDDASKSILKFDLLKYQSRKDILDKNREKRNLSGKTEPEEPQPQTEFEQPKVEQKQIEQKIEELKKEVVIQPEKFIEEQEEESVEEYEEPNEEVEFDKKGTVKQKKGSTSLIIMGIGAFILTWGAVNFFKERR